MRLLITGSIATDHLMTYPGRFGDQFIAGKLDRISLSFLVDELVVRRGGVAANIAFGLAALGFNPVLVGAAGTDFDDYRSWLDRHGVQTHGVHVAPELHTARFLCTTDEAQNQIASFYAGAMRQAHTIELAPVVSRAGGVDLVHIAPNDPRAMIRHTQECRERGYRFAADPSQQLARMDGEEIRALTQGAHVLFTNEYEHELLLSKSKWTKTQVLDQVGLWVTTLAEHGVLLESADRPAIRIPAAPAVSIVDPTGVGDAFRAGFLGGMAWGLDEVFSAKVGCTLATLVLESTGAQEYVYSAEDFSRRLSDAYGPELVTAVSDAS
ncbi:adenosine kinase [Kibdelosporangium banguiense]|uniref:Adenosine kinase n=1 Tax=Kibdelosporangium banguiense TaxID=1365924 RepID=A0ABS4TYF7_9PSEU|nr:carbohydrate kinase family protein [Kibdelosporangium banguiense]MBP2329406.1 adenosine kinase [Kibdelosporangium banguiense]